jgi:hypothetical protein
MRSLARLWRGLRHEGDAVVADRLARLIGLSWLALAGATWPLWVGPLDGHPAAVPWAEGLPVLPFPAAALLFAATLAAGLTAALRPGRLAMAALAVGIAAMAAQDRHRLQPWAYQFALLSAAWAVSPGAAPRLARLFTVALYLHSGLSKLDVAFAAGTGRQFLGVLAPSMDAEGPAGIALILAMPLAELLTGLALAVPAARPLGLAMALTQHVVLLRIVGPWGLGHSVGVVGWNVFFLAQDVLLFRGRPAAEQERSSWSQRAIATAFAVLLLLPFGERFGVWDPWPSFALYSSHDARVILLIGRDDPVPPEVAESVSPAAGDSPWRRVDLNDWSFRSRRSPLYPSVPAWLAVAADLADRHPECRWRAVVLGPAGVMSLRRERTELDGAEAMRRRRSDRTR